jgi:hypothetical protein
MPPSDQPVPPSYPPSVIGRRFSYEGKVYLADTVGMRWVTNPAVYNALFRDWNGITALRNPAGPLPSESALASYLQSGPPDYRLFMLSPMGPALPEDAVLMKDPPAPAVYLVDGNMKRHIASPDIMDQYYFNWNVIQAVPAATLAALTAGAAVDATPNVELGSSSPMYVAVSLDRVTYLSET